MTLLWTTPRQWATNEPITKEKLNAISDDLLYLVHPSGAMATVRGTGTDIAITSTTQVQIDDLSYLLTCELSGAKDVTVDFNGMANNNTLSALNVFDVLIDGTTYLSSLTATPLANGVIGITQAAANAIVVVKLEVQIPVGVLSAGFHTFAPRARVSAGTMTWRKGTRYFSQFHVGEG